MTERADFLVNNRSPRYLHGFQKDTNETTELPHTVPVGNQVTYTDSFTNYGVDTVYGKEYVIAAGSSPTVHNSLPGRSDADTHPASSITNTPAGDIAATTVQAAINELDSEKVAANVAITGSTKTKITYDSKGLVTAGSDATASDIVNTPAGNISAATVQAAINELDSEKGGLSSTNSWTAMNSYSTSGVGMRIASGSGGYSAVQFQSAPDTIWGSFGTYSGDVYFGRRNLGETGTIGDIVVRGTSGDIFFGSTTASTSTTTGALVVGGGVGVGGALYVGGDAHVSSRIGVGNQAPLVRVHATATAGDTYPILGTTAGQVFVSGDGNRYGMFIGTDTVSGNGWIQQMRNNAATAYNLILQPVGGSVSVGSTTIPTNSRFHSGGPFSSGVYTVATLPTGAAGMRSFVSDANATTFASIVAGGGANGVPVYHDGTNWRIG